MPKAEWQGFVNIRLNDTHKKEIKKLAEKSSPETVLDWLLTELDSGYKVSLSPDEDNGAVIATLYGYDADSVNAGLAMSQRHQDAVIAICALQFAHVEIAQRGEWESAQADPFAVDW